MKSSDEEKLIPSTTIFLSFQEPSLREVALVVVRDVVENQFECLASAGHEADVFQLLFRSREDLSRTVKKPVSLSLLSLEDFLTEHTSLCLCLSSF